MSRKTNRKRSCIGRDSRADERALARMGEKAAAARPACWPGDVRDGIFDGTRKRKFPASGGGIRGSFALKRDLNRPMQPRSSDLPRGFPGDSPFALPAGGRTWGVKDG